jgi:signal transduction histidine kinase
MAERVMEEGRDQVHELRTFVLHNGDLRRALSLVGEVLQESRGVAFRLDTAGEDIRLTERASAEVYGIAREAIMNAFRHADAQRIVVLLSYRTDQFTLRVQDDGKGLPPAVLAGQAPRGHWGLTGMRERAARLGGTLSVGPGPDGAGTSVALALPAPAAYGIHRRWRLWRFLYRGPV